MLKISCDKCNKKLRLDDKLLGRRVRCPACRSVIVVPLPEEPIDSQMPFWMQAFLGVCGLIAALVIASLWIGAAGSVLVAVLIVGATFAILHRDRVYGWGKATKTAVLRTIETTQNSLQKPATDSPSADSHSRQILSVEIPLQAETLPDRTPKKTEAVVSALHSRERSTRNTGRDTDELVEIRVAAPAATPVRNVDSEIPSSSGLGWFRSPKSSDVRFYGPSTVIRLEGRTIESPLVYYVDGTLHAPLDASLIESGLRVAKYDNGYVDDLPYWPTYRGSTPEQRKRYLDWLTSGRCRPDVSVSYPFIYFYGLERRALIDRRDHEAILREVLRLLPIYQASRSFQRYGSAFIWTVIATLPEPLPADLLQKTIASTSYWNEDNLSVLLGHYHANSCPLPPEVAYIAAEHDPRTPRSVVVRRHPDRFRELFVRRCSEKFGGGMMLRAAKNTKRFCYSPASATLGHEYSGSYSAPISLPNTLGLSSQFKPLIEIWSSAIDDLKLFDRAHRKSSDKQMTAAMYESLPVELRGEDHPHFEMWYAVINRNVDDAGWSLVPVGELAAVRGIAERSRLTKSQSEELVRAADSMELAIEPDCRLTGQTYRWNELISVFPREESLDLQDSSYHAASILLRLGMTIAAADGAVDASEINAVTSHLEERFHLTQQSSIRLEHLSQVLTRCPSDDTRIAKQIQHLPLSDREVIGAFLVAVAAADEIVTSEEVKALRKTFRNLGLDASTLNGLASGRVAVDGAADSDTDQLVLDPDRIRQILAETDRVAKLLKTVMISDEVSDEAQPPHIVVPPSNSPTSGLGPSLPSQFETSIATKAVLAKSGISIAETMMEGLHSRYHAFLQTLISRSQWTAAEFESIARQNRLMPQGAIDSVNEWSNDRFGDFLIESDGGEVTVHLELLTTE